MRQLYTKEIEVENDKIAVFSSFDSSSLSTGLNDQLTLTTSA